MSTAKLAPGIEQKFLVFYELPADAKGLRLRVNAIAPNRVVGPKQIDVDLGVVPAPPPAVPEFSCNDAAFPVPCGAVCCPRGATCNPSAPGNQKCLLNTKIQCKRSPDADVICEGEAKLGYNCWGGTVGEVTSAFPTCEFIADSKFCCSQAGP